MNATNAVPANRSNPMTRKSSHRPTGYSVAALQAVARWGAEPMAEASARVAWRHRAQPRSPPGQLAP
eukprot:4163807-Lingulodinium_polyedra.AAC.1